MHQRVHQHLNQHQHLSRHDSERQRQLEPEHFGENELQRQYGQTSHRLEHRPSTSTTAQPSSPTVSSTDRAPRPAAITISRSRTGRASSSPASNNTPRANTLTIQRGKKTNNAAKEAGSQKAANAKKCTTYPPLSRSSARRGYKWSLVGGKQSYKKVRPLDVPSRYTLKARERIEREDRCFVIERLSR